MGCVRFDCFNPLLRNQRLAKARSDEDSCLVSRYRLVGLGMDIFLPQTLGSIDALIRVAGRIDPGLPAPGGDRCG